MHDIVAKCNLSTTFCLKYQVLSNQEAADCIKDIKDARSAAKHLNEHALARGSTDDISCVVVRFQ